MSVNKNIEVKIIPKSENISWEAITNLLHAAHAEKTEKGRDFLATHQDAETTKKRVGNGICFLAYIGEKLVGTIALDIRDVNEHNRKWHNKKRYGLIFQLGVHPDFKGLGIGRKLMDKGADTARENEVDELIGDTSIKAKELLSWYKSLGYEFTGLLSHPTTDYYSIEFRKPLYDNKFPPIYVKLKFYKSVIKCFLLYNKLGKTRKIWKIIGRF